MSAEAFSERLYPIGAFSDREVADVRLDLLCADKVGMDELLGDWRAKSAEFRSRPSQSADGLDTDLLPLRVSQELSVA